MAKKKAKKSKRDGRFSEQYAQLGTRIRELRKKRGYTSALKFAFDHELSHVQMVRWEQGGNMNFESILRLSDAFGISVAELLRDF